MWGHRSECMTSVQKAIVLGTNCYTTRCCFPWCAPSASPSKIPMELAALNCMTILVLADTLWIFLWQASKVIYDRGGFNQSCARFVAEEADPGDGSHATALLVPDRWPGRCAEKETLRSRWMRMVDSVDCSVARFLDEDVRMIDQWSMHMVTYGKMKQG